MQHTVVTVSDGHSEHFTQCVIAFTILCLISGLLWMFSLFACQGREAPLVLLLFNGGPVDVTFAQESPEVDAIIACGYPAQATGEALYRVLTGKGPHSVPAGRLPATWPAQLNQVIAWDCWHYWIYVYVCWNRCSWHGPALLHCISRTCCRIRVKARLILWAILMDWNSHIFRIQLTKTVLPAFALYASRHW